MSDNVVLQHLPCSLVASPSLTALKTRLSLCWGDFVSRKWAGTSWCSQTSSPDLTQCLGAEGSEPAESDLSFGKGPKIHLQTSTAKAAVSARIIVAALYWVFLSGNTRGLLNAWSVGSHILLINISLTGIPQGWPSFLVKSNGQFRCMGNSGPPLTARGPSLGTKREVQSSNHWDAQVCAWCLAQEKFHWSYCTRWKSGVHWSASPNLEQGSGLREPKCCCECSLRTRTLFMPWDKSGWEGWWHRQEWQLCSHWGKGRFPSLSDEFAIHKTGDLEK